MVAGVAYAQEPAVTSGELRGACVPTGNIGKYTEWHIYNLKAGPPKLFSCCNVKLILLLQSLIVNAAIYDTEEEQHMLLMSLLSYSLH